MKTRTRENAALPISPQNNTVFSPFANCSSNIIASILAFTSPHEVARVSETCHFFNHFFKTNHTYWRNKFLSHYPDSYGSSFCRIDQSFTWREAYHEAMWTDCEKIYTMESLMSDVLMREEEDQALVDSTESSSGDQIISLLYRIKENDRARIRIDDSIMPYLDATDSTGRSLICWASIKGNQPLLNAYYLFKIATLPATDDNNSAEANMIALRHQLALAIVCKQDAELIESYIHACDYALRDTLLNTPAYHGMTPMCLAAFSYSPNALRQLLRNGADYQACDLKNRTPIEYAAASGYTDLLNILLQVHCVSHGNQDELWFALWLAAENHHIDCIELLVKSGADINRVFDAQTCKNLLTLAIAENRPDMVEIFLRHKANPDFVFPCGRTADDIAYTRGYEKSAKVLHHWRVKDQPHDQLVPACERRESDHYVMKKRKT